MRYAGTSAPCWMGQSRPHLRLAPPETPPPPLSLRPQDKAPSVQKVPQKVLPGQVLAQPPPPQLAQPPVVGERVVWLGSEEA
jgi:hypothetical protein